MLLKNYLKRDELISNVNRILKKYTDKNLEEKDVITYKNKEKDLKVDVLSFKNNDEEIAYICESIIENIENNVNKNIVKTSKQLKYKKQLFF